MSAGSDKVHLVRITTAPISMRLLLTGQPHYMQDSGFEVTLISAEGDDWRHIPQLEKFRVHKVNMARQISLWKDLRSLFHLILLFTRLRPDIVHTHTPKAGLLGMVAAALTLVPVRIHTVAGLPLMTTTGAKRRLLIWAEKLTYLCADEVWINSKTLRRNMIEMGLVKKAKARIILSGSSNGIDLSQFAPEEVPAERLQALRDRHGLGSEHFVLLAVGRMVADKGIPELVDAFARLHTQHPHTRLLLLGPLEEDLDPLPAHTKVQMAQHPAIIHEHWSDEVNAYMGLANAFVHASHREGFPNVVLQAGAMGLPTVVSDIPGNVDIVQHEGEGFVYPVKNADSLLAHLHTLVENPKMAATRANALQQKVRSQFSRPVMHEAIKMNYLRLLQIQDFDVQSIH